MQPKTRFLDGKMVWASWDVMELADKAAEIQNSSIMTIRYDGSPFSPLQKLQATIQCGLCAGVYRSEYV